MHRKIFASCFIVLLVCFFVFSVSAEPATWMRSGVAYDFLNFSIVKYRMIESDQYIPCDNCFYSSEGIFAPSFLLQFSDNLICNQFFVTIEIGGIASSVTPDFKLVNSVQEMSGTIISHTGNKFVVKFVGGSGGSSAWLRLELGELELHRGYWTKLIDVTGIGETNVVFGNFTNYKITSNVGVNQSASINQSYYTLNSLAYVTDNAVFGGVFTETITLLVPRPAGIHDWISFRVYLPSTTINFDSVSGDLSSSAGSPLVSVGLGYCSNINSISYFPGTVTYETASSLTYFQGATSICYDFTVDVSNAIVDFPYYAITLELLPYNYLESTHQLVFGARFNGGGVGTFTTDTNELNTFVDWYYSYSEYKYNGWVRTFTNYMDTIINALNGNGVMDSANAAIADNKEIEDAAIAGAVSAVGDITSLELPTEFTNNVGILSAVGSSLVSGSMAPVYLCLVIIPLTVGIISKLLNGGD